MLAGGAPPLLIPALDNQGRPTLRRGAQGGLVADMQTRLAIRPADGMFGGQAEAALRAFQLSKDIVPDGIVGPKTWAELSL